MTRPTATESLRAMQSAVAEVLAPEVRSLFGQEAVSAVGMLVESLNAEIDTAAETGRRDAEALRSLLEQGRAALASVAGRNEKAGALVKEIDGVLSQAGDGSLILSSLAFEINRLRGALVTLIEFCEDAEGEPGHEALAPVRAAVFRHLREVSVRGWSFFDVSGFRERIVSARAEVSG